MNTPDTTMNGKNIVKRLHYIQKWRRGAKIIMPSPEEVGKAIDDAIRYIRQNEKNKKASSRYISGIVGFSNKVHIELR